MEEDVIAALFSYRTVSLSVASTSDYKRVRREVNSGRVSEHDGICQRRLGGEPDSGSLWFPW